MAKVSTTTITFKVDGVDTIKKFQSISNAHELLRRIEKTDSMELVQVVYPDWYLANLARANGEA